MAIKSIRLFKKYVGMTKRENSQEIRDVKARYRDTKPRMHKSRRRGLLPGLLNVGIEMSRSSHEASLENELRPLEFRKDMYDELLLACDQLIHEVEIQIAEND